MPKELGTLTVPVVTALPGTASTGQLVSFGGTIYQYSGAAWFDLSAQNVAVLKVAADITNATTTSQNTGLSFVASANSSYEFEATVMWQQASISAGIRLSLTGPASPTYCYAVIETQTSQTVFSIQSEYNYAAGTATTSIDTAGLPRLARVTGVIVTTTAGAVNIQFASSSTSAVTIKKGSTLKVF
jgi:hypothetical protein